MDNSKKTKKIIFSILFWCFVLIVDAFLYSLSIKIFLIINFIVFVVFASVYAYKKGKIEREEEQREDRIIENLDKFLQSQVDKDDLEQ